MAVKIITPYVFDEEIKEHQNMFWDLDIYYEKDVAGIGCDLMFQKMWNKFPEDDIFILHADMSLHHDDWFEEVQDYVEKYPEAGMFGCLLLYPAKDAEDRYYVQCGGGKFTDEKPDHFGSGLILENGQVFKSELEFDTGQYDAVRKLHGQRLEDVISDDPLLTRLGISTQLTNGHTTETWITAFEDEKPVNVYIRFQSDSFITNLETRNE